MSEEIKDTVTNTDTSTSDVNAPNQAPNSSEVQKVTLEDLKAQIQNLTLTNAKLKRANDKLASENGDLNKKFRERLSDDEKRELELTEAEERRKKSDAEKDELIRSLQLEKQINTLTNGYLAMGWTSDEAQRMATADANNDFETRMKIMSEVNERQRKAYDVEVLKNRQPINVGTGNSVGDITKEQFDKMSYKEVIALKMNNPEAFEQFSH